MHNLKLNAIAALTVTLGLSLTLITAPVSAAKKGPRASVSVATTCALNGTTLDVTVNVRDKTSGSAIAVVDDWTIDAVYKNRSNRGNVTTRFDGDASAVDMPVGDGLTIERSFDLCDSLGDLPADLRALSANTSVRYGKDDGVGGVADTRTIMNSCSDDPATEDVEPSGIKVNYDELATACTAP
jgi:hypothetical protein